MKPDYKSIMEHLRTVREDAGVSIYQLSERLQIPNEQVVEAEEIKRKLDFVELNDWINALEYPLMQFLSEIGWIDTPESSPDHVFPIENHVVRTDMGILLNMKHQSGVTPVYLTGITPKNYLKVEKFLTTTYRALNKKSSIKNRDAIHNSLVYSINNLPDANPSDVYQHIVYRIYLREYIRSDPEQSWRRAGGEAMELFVQSQYNTNMLKQGVKIVALISSDLKKKALIEMGLSDEVGGSKLDIALYGNFDGKWVIFGGVHCKASLAERVSDDVPTSTAMMRRGLLSILYTFDSKSFPPPSGDLVNRGELGSPETPSDKRKYIEEHGAFDACFCYNTRSNASKESTKSGKRIYVSDFKLDNDKFPEFVLNKWNKYKENLNK